MLGFNQASKTSSSIIDRAVSLFTTAQTELSEGIALGKTEAKDIQTNITKLGKTLVDVNTKIEYGEAIHKNISNLLNIGK